MASNKLRIAIFMIDKLGFVAKSIKHPKEGDVKVLRAGFTMNMQIEC